MNCEADGRPPASVAGIRSGLWCMWLEALRTVRTLAGVGFTSGRGPTALVVEIGRGISGSTIDRSRIATKQENACGRIRIDRTKGGEGLLGNYIENQKNAIETHPDMSTITKGRWTET